MGVIELIVAQKAGPEHMTECCDAGLITGSCWPRAIARAFSSCWNLAVHVGHHVFVLGNSDRAVTRTVVVDKVRREIAIGRLLVLSVHEVLEVLANERLHMV